MLYFTSPTQIPFMLVATVLALVASLAAVPALALALAWVNRRVAGAAPSAGPRVEGGIALGLGAAAGFLAFALLAYPESLGPLLAAFLGLAALTLVAIGGAMLASSASRAALRTAVGCGPGALPPSARALFGLALAVGCWSLGVAIHAAASVRGPIAWPTGILVVLAVAAAGAPGADGGLVPVLLPTVVPPFVIWAVGRAAMIAGAVGLLRARYAGTLLYSAGLALAFRPRVPRLSVSSAVTLAVLAVDVGTLVLAWTHVRGCPATSPPPPHLEAS